MDIQNKLRNTNLKFRPGALEPFVVLGHAVGICIGLDALLDLTGVVENAAVAVHEVLNDGQVVVGRGVAEDGVIPCFEVRVVRNEVREGVPLVLGGNQTRTVRADVGRGRAGRFEGIRRPRSGVVGSTECGSTIERGVRLAREK